MNRRVWPNFDRRGGRSIRCLRTWTAWRRPSGPCEAGHEVIYQGRLCEEAFPHPRPLSRRERGETEYFLGRPDFLVRTAGPSALGNYGYEVWDVTLATQPSPAQMMQLCCSADLLRAVQEQRSDFDAVVARLG